MVQPTLRIGNKEKDILNRMHVKAMKQLGAFEDAELSRDDIDNVQKPAFNALMTYPSGEKNIGCLSLLAIQTFLMMVEGDKKTFNAVISSASISVKECLRKLGVGDKCFSMTARISIK